MTKDEIISIAKKFGLATWHNGLKRWTLEIGLEQFTAEVEAFAAAKEREACANVCDARYMSDNNREDMEAKRCAEAIRARS